MTGRDLQTLKYTHKPLILLDSGANNHFFCDRDFFKELKPPTERNTRSETFKTTAYSILFQDDKDTKEDLLQGL